MTIQEQEHFLRTLYEIAAHHYGCTVEEITFKRKPPSDPEEQRQETESA